MDNTPKQARVTQKSLGSRDAKSLQHNKNRTVEPPPMPEDVSDTSIAQRIGNRGHGSYPPKVVSKVLEETRKGLSLSQISQLAGMPSFKTLTTWRQQDPDFAEEVESAFDQAVDNAAKRMLRLAETIPKVKGLKGYPKVIAIDKQIQRTLQIAASRLPRSWGRDTIGGGETIVLEVGAIDKTLHAPGSEDGQNEAALRARKVIGVEEE